MTASQEEPAEIVFGYLNPSARANRYSSFRRAAPLLSAELKPLRSSLSLPRLLYYLAVPNRSPRTPSCCVIALFSTILRKSRILGRGLSSDFRRFKLLRSPRPCSRERILFTPLGTQLLRWEPLTMDTQIWGNPDILSLPRKRKCDWLKPQNMEIENISNTALRNEAVKALPWKQVLLNVIVG